ncbi:MAG: hypothetical protein AAGI30_00340 [Planctomycetota bacterium]
MSDGSTARVLSRTRTVVCFDPDPAAREAITGVLGTLGFACVPTPDIDAARAASEDASYDVLLVALTPDDEDTLAFIEQRARSGAAGRVMATCDAPDARLAIEAMRRGCVDLLVKPIVRGELIERVEAAAVQADALRSQARRIDRLKRICRRLSDRRDEANAEQTAANIAADMEAAFQRIAGQVGALTMATDFGTRLKGELDIETILRTTLEYLLGKLGPTNAAVFLPTGSGDYALSAYVNHDVSGDNAEFVLDHLADVVPARYEEYEQVAHLTSSEAVDEAVGEAAPWLEQSDVLVLACRGETDTLAVVMLFRDRSEPFDLAMMPELETLRAVLADQLGRVVKIHNRAKPDADWNGFFVDTDETYDADAEDDTPDWGDSLAA